MKLFSVVIVIAAISYSGLNHGTSLRSEQIKRAADAAAAEQADPNGTARIVGGSNTDPDDYPFMSALVAVSQQIATSVNVSGTEYASNDFSFTPEGSASGNLVSCGLAGETCTGVQGSICLIERGEFNFSVKALNCEAGGGIGAIIYNNVPGPITNGTLGNDFNGNIPVVAISQENGQSILQLQNPTASINVSTLGGATQNANCGATFLGDRWALTAAHCVDSSFSNQLRVNVGEYDLRNGAEDAIGIARIYIHPNYIANEFDYDVALLELTESVDAPTISLADAATTLEFTSENRIAKSIGWGGRIGYAPGDGPTGNFPDILQEVELPLLTNTQCRNIFSESRNISPASTGVTDRMICAAVDMGGRSACQGDSGGPLFVETNTGPVQVGITSWGIGCAAQGYPGVYARVGELMDFIDATRFGVGITGIANFTNSPVNSGFTQQYTVTNNSENTVNLSFGLSNPTDFSVDSSNCTSLQAGQSCQLNVSISANTPGLKQAQLSVTADITETPTSGISILGFAVADASGLQSAAGVASAEVSLFSGGDRVWQVNNTGGVASGNITDRQESILIARIEGQGTLQFEWSVSSEENVDEPSEPFDALYLLVNGIEQNFISGEVPFTSVSVPLNEEVNLVEWAYRKDPGVTEGDDEGRVRNVQFTPNQAPTPAPSPTPSVPSSGGDSGGGAAVWLLIGLIMVGWRRTRLI